MTNGVFKGSCPSVEQQLPLLYKMHKCDKKDDIQGCFVKGEH